MESVPKPEPILDFWGRTGGGGGGLSGYERMNETHLPSRIALVESSRETVSLPQLAVL